MDEQREEPAGSAPGTAVSRRLITLANGRSVDVVEAGDPDGAPVLVLHGTPTGPLEVGMHAGTASELGLRLVSPGRPGYAGSTPSERTGLSVVVEDTREVLDRLGITTYAVLGISGGGPFAASVTARTSPRTPARGLAILSGVAPREQWGPPADEEDAEERRLLDLAAAGDRTGAAAGIASLIATADVDGAPAPIRECFADASRNGHAGYAFDVLSWGLPWDVDVAGVGCPAWLVYGAADASCPPAYGEWYRAQVPQAELWVVPGADHGGAIMAGAPKVLRHLRGQLS
ncbi:MAG TPA: alpha/beta hydrolase [Marmoricola sp.]|nr:alpha/beta hydrolase [Marmoricola sp.]